MAMTAGADKVRELQRTPHGSPTFFTAGIRLSAWPHGRAREHRPDPAIRRKLGTLEAPHKCASRGCQREAEKRMVGSVHLRPMCVLRKLLVRGFGAFLVR